MKTACNECSENQSCKRCQRNATSARYRQRHKARIQEQSQDYYRRNKDQILARNEAWRDKNPDYGKQHGKKYRTENAELVKQQWKTYYATHMEEILSRAQEYHKQNAPRRRELDRARLRDNLQYRLAQTLRTRTRAALVAQSARKVGSAVEELGCTPSELIQHLESQFADGMSWSNYGLGRESWSIDHIRPLSSFDLSNEEQFKQAAHYTNLQPLWHIENIRKGARWDD